MGSLIARPVVSGRRFTMVTVQINFAPLALMGIVWLVAVVLAWPGGQVVAAVVVLAAYALLLVASLMYRHEW